MQIRSLLADNLPKASNFYISYFLLQGFFMSAVRIVHLGSLFRNVLLAHIGGPRLISRRYHYLRRMHWGTVYPIFTNMGVIGKLTDPPGACLDTYIVQQYHTRSSLQLCLEWH